MTGDGPERIAALIERIGRLLSTDAHAGGLLPVQWEALRYLGRANRFSRTPAALTAYLGLTKGTVSQTVHALEARGLVTKQVDPVDRRGRRLSLSPAGRTLLMRDPLVETVTAIRTPVRTATSGDRAGARIDTVLPPRCAAAETVWTVP